MISVWKVFVKIAFFINIVLFYFSVKMLLHLFVCIWYGILITEILDFTKLQYFNFSSFDCMVFLTERK
jgi:hypothetical protein